MKKAFDIDPKILPSLLAGGAGALAGGTLTAMSPEREGESRGHRRMRILRNALLLGGAGAGGAALLQGGLHNTLTPLPASDVDPTKKFIHDSVYSKAGIGAQLGLGATGLGLLSAAEEKAKATSLLSSLTNRLNLNSQAQTMHNHTAPISAVRNWFTTNENSPARPVDPNEVVAGKVYNVPVNSSDMADINDIGARIKYHQKSNMGDIPGTTKPGWGGIAKDEVSLWKNRLTGLNREGASMTKRLGGLGLLLAAPKLLSDFTAYDEPAPQPAP